MMMIWIHRYAKDKSERQTALSGFRDGTSLLRWMPRGVRVRQCLPVLRQYCRYGVLCSPVRHCGTHRLPIAAVLCGLRTTHVSSTM
ncbi:hypothetical protein Y032_0028g1657 [Ancylostoma ceylanicum]|uniref:Uncharacterized protein n=1 Tax=Ancylostoma ceylanicum TaxID=53326 RepID=A0A016UUD6_9BILA|nr:hypothetical protein Y032_0028g1657 [Ancylostoma ceylanicum]